MKLSWGSCVVLLTAGAMLCSAPAGAATSDWTELPSQPAANNQGATCLRGDGQERLSMLGPLGDATVATDFFSATSAGLAFTNRTTLGFLDDCAISAVNSSGTQLLAGVERGLPSQLKLRASIREPSGATSFFDITTSKPDQVLASLTGTLSNSGDALLAWEEYTTTGPSAQTRVFVSRRPSGGSFSPPQPVTDTFTGPEFGNVGIASGVDDAGNTTLSWASAPPKGESPLIAASIQTTSAAPNAAFEPAATLVSNVDALQGLALDVAPDGRRVIVLNIFDGLRVFERDASQASYSQTAKLTPPTNQKVFTGLAEPTIEVVSGGSAVIAWRTAGRNETATGVQAAYRSGTGAFGPAVDVFKVPPTNSSSGSSTFLTGSNRPTEPLDEQNTRLRALLSGDGQILISWTGQRAFGQDRIDSPMVAVGSLTGKTFTARLLGSPCRVTNGTAPLRTNDGTSAIAWTDNVTSVDFGPGSSAASTSDGRLHLAVHRPQPEPGGQPPTLRLKVPKKQQRLAGGEGLKVKATCDRPCDVRAFVPDTKRKSPRSFPGGGPRAAGSAYIAKANTATSLAVAPGIKAYVDPHRAPSTVTVKARACDPVTNQMREVTAKAKVARRAPRRVPPPHNVSARRSKGKVVVGWRLARRARSVYFVVTGSKSRHGGPLAYKLVESKNRKRFSTTLSAKSIKFVEVTSTVKDANATPRSKIVRVR